MSDSADHSGSSVPTGKPGDTAGESMVGGNRPLRISYLDGPRLRRSILAGVSHVTRDREELDRINVFPVPDGDTGTNLALSLAAIEDAVRPSTLIP